MSIISFHQDITSPHEQRSKFDSHTIFPRAIQKQSLRILQEGKGRAVTIDVVVLYILSPGTIVIVVAWAP